MTDTVRKRPRPDQTVVDRQFDADEEARQSRRLRLLLFVQGAHVVLTPEETEGLLTSVDGDGLRGDGYVLTLLWRLAESATDPVIREAIEARVTHDYAEFVDTCDLRATVGQEDLTNAPPEGA